MPLTHSLHDDMISIAPFSSEPWGTLPGGDPVRLFTLRNAHGMKVAISDLGATGLGVLRAAPAIASGAMSMRRDFTCIWRLMKCSSAAVYGCQWLLSSARFGRR